MIYVLFLIPILIMIVGLIMFKYPPKKINIFVGYRTKKSMKNEKAWKKANQYCGKIWMLMGLIMVFVSILLFLFDLFSMVNFSEPLLSTLVLVQTAIIILPIFIVEKSIEDEE